ncbi:MAG: hypothetical protein EPN93_01250 [Spirochaetes bacterium]|nr:MAG: hypothetical protein EPN93_01250 [Spirochaetota bacterium]
MKYVHDNSIWKGFRALVVGLIVLAACPAMALEVSFLIGEVSVLREGVSVPASLSMPLNPGDMIVTGADGLVTLHYADGSEVKISEGTTLRVGSAATKDADSISVISGSVLTAFQKISKDAEDRKVYTPTTVCAVRGTKFAVTVSKGADSRVDLSEGKLDVHNPYGKVEVNPDEDVEVGVGEEPEKQDLKGSTRDWKAGRDQEFSKDPKEKSSKFRKYVGTLGDRSAKSSDNAGKLNSGMGKAGKSKAELEKTGAEIGELEENIKDDMMLSDNATSSIDGILKDFQSRKDDIYSNFLKVKEESNKVREQQKKNYESIMAVKQAYKKAYDEIMGTHKGMVDKIKGGMNKDSVKPPIEK